MYTKVIIPDTKLSSYTIASAIHLSSIIYALLPKQETVVMKKTKASKGKEGKTHYRVRRHCEADSNENNKSI